MKRAVTQFSLTGELVARYESIREAANTTGFPKESILACCTNKNAQSNNYIWMYREDESQVSQRIVSLFNPNIPECWGMEWRDVKGYEGRYKVSELGVIISIPHLTSTNGVIKFWKFNKMSPLKNINGYYCVKLSDCNRRQRLLIHRIVAEAFIANPNGYPCVNHKDENKSNNCVNNLEWCTVEYNNNYGSKNSRSATKNKNGKMSKPVIQLDKEGHTIKEYPTIQEAKRQGFDTSYISKCCLGKAHSHKGYIWKYK